MPVRIAEDDLQPGAKHVVVEGCELLGDRARLGGADGGFATARIFKRFRGRGMPDREDLVGVAHVADPVEVTQVGLETLVQSECLIDCEALADDGENRPVTGRDFRDIIRCDNAAAAGHVDREYTRVARNVAPDVARQQPRIGIVATAARARADDELDRLALIEITDGIGAGKTRLQGDAGKTSDASYQDEPRRNSAHASSKARRAVAAGWARV